METYDSSRTNIMDQAQRVGLIVPLADISMYFFKLAAHEERARNVEGLERAKEHMHAASRACIALSEAAEKLEGYQVAMEAMSAEHREHVETLNRELLAARTYSATITGELRGARADACELQQLLNDAEVREEGLRRAIVQLGDWNGELHKRVERAEKNYADVMARLEKVAAKYAAHEPPKG